MGRYFNFSGRFTVLSAILLCVDISGSVLKSEKSMDEGVTLAP